MEKNWEKASLLRHGPEMVNSFNTYHVHITY